MDKNFLSTIISASLDAGKSILEIYKTDFNVEYKSDSSPLTQADKSANEVIMSYLKKTRIPVLSEEGRNIPYSERKNWKRLWIVDPLDGTKEFVKKNGEFTVNIALVENQVPVMGVVYAPVLDILYVGDRKEGAYKIEQAGKKQDINKELKEENRIPKKNPKNYFGIVASRSHLTKETEDFIKKLEKAHSNVKIVSKGSSLKLCMVAEGEADIYPRFAPTSEWDTAAGDAIVRAAGGKVLIANTNEPLVYNKEDILNPWFVVTK
ncbi:3'(2'),5'-bisphosphate nucleotidase CysQ [Candidatus Sulfidibacterium hydrothermale]|uniref:3'(2'),5'-bisphosphate nucleotidase CysQ n=1 Tax=Candidatus Sulfidibacterium hydrothermale TaxID=2875962 RepID=UPI001F0AE370|nr:3'(2'),5'-bisphosphate nucleotidase CysQ [Candidatus Sulfidibacterium hydrothermale]UBM62469.1 3'(2'),5'-bisphosphate nucleotidase CysQ [Candidatus Sulfidibacterium hydrothermale]